MNKTLIIKFGGASVATIQRFDSVADIICARHEEYKRIVIVVSAMGDMTDQLIKLAKQVHNDPPRREYDMLLSVGERISMALLAMLLHKRGKEACSYTGSQSGIITSNNHSSASIVDVRPFRLIEDLNQHRIPIVAGFQGVSRDKNVTTLGRGGSDLTAVALGIALEADKVEFYKDVPGICTADPNENPEAKLLKTLNYEEALKIIRQGSGILHDRAVLLAQKNNLILHVRPFKDFNPANKSDGTLIGELSKSKMREKVYESEEVVVSL